MQTPKAMRSVLGAVRHEVKDAASGGNPNILSKQEAAKLNPDLRETAAECRKANGTVTVNDVVDAFAVRVNKSLHSVNKNDTKTWTESELASIKDQGVQKRLLDVMSSKITGVHTGFKSDAELVKIATSFVREHQDNNAEAEGSYDDRGFLFPHPESGNCGTYAYMVQGDQAKVIAELGKHQWRGEDALNKFDPARHALVVVIATEDEEFMLLNVMDRATGKIEHSNASLTVDWHFANVGPDNYDDMDDATYDTLLGKYANDVRGNDPYDKFDTERLFRTLTEGATKLNIGNPEDYYD